MYWHVLNFDFQIFAMIAMIVLIGMFIRLWNPEVPKTRHLAVQNTCSWSQLKLYICIHCLTCHTKCNLKFALTCMKIVQPPHNNTRITYHKFWTHGHCPVIVISLLQKWQWEKCFYVPETYHKLIAKNHKKKLSIYQMKSGGLSPQIPRECFWKEWRIWKEKHKGDDVFEKCFIQTFYKMSMEPDTEFYTLDLLPK